jgi:hypothetical protein
VTGVGIIATGSNIIIIDGRNDTDGLNVTITKLASDEYAT